MHFFLRYAKVAPGDEGMKNKLKGSILLTLATVIWGSAFVAQSVGMDHIGPFTFQAVRCAIAVLGLLPVIFISDCRTGGASAFLSRWRDKRLWLAGLACSAPLFLAVNLQQLGIVSTDAGKSAFLTAMYIIIVPLLGLFLKRKISKMIPISVVLAVIGLYLLTCAGVSRITSGDLLLIGCAFMFAVQIICVDHFADKVDPLRLNCLQSLFCSIGSAVVMFLFETPVVQDIAACWLPLCYAGFLSMGIAYSFQIIGQKNVEPNAASLIMSLESVFAVLFGWLLLHETMNPNEAMGCILMFTAVILSQLELPAKKSE